MNRTHLEHTVIALVIQLALWPLLGPWGAGFTACAVFLGREIAQHEAKGGGAKAVPWYYGAIRHWSRDSILDVVLPAAVCAALALGGAAL
ncbi:hypothetical protein [Halomonas nitroreducens]|uniref:Uncharacterized protein n=1 Tax=Halomonas nitroreducens TaxID=447425 RepID=A0A431V329_9GAMM|nr:hypothetical protein [Halomonas nitroreducens]RTR01930.1 hypothetical protein EKG36_13050 [Halomonas nitroreducens]